MVKRFFFCLSIFVLLLQAQEKPDLKLGPKAEPPAMGSDYQPLLWRGSDSGFVLETLRSGKCQLETSGLVASKSSDSALRQIAADSIESRQHSTKKLKSMAKAIGFKLPSKKHPISCEEAGNLADLGGDKFETAYLGYLSKANADDHARYQAEATAVPNSANFDLRRYAAGAVPVLEQQQKSIDDLKSKITPAKK